MHFSRGAWTSSWVLVSLNSCEAAGFDYRRGSKRRLLLFGQHRVSTGKLFGEIKPAGHGRAGWPKNSLPKVESLYPFLWCIMWLFDSVTAIKTPEHRLAWAVAIIADALQILAFPLFAEGGMSPADTALDIVVAAALSRLLGWHWAFLPTLAAELVPGLDMFPTWTAAVFFVTRQRVRSADAEQPEILPPGPAPLPR